MAPTRFQPTSFYERLRHLAPYGEEPNRELFAEWYPRVKEQLANVPADVAEHWLHRHWGHSPFYFLPLETMRFSQVQWSRRELDEVRFTERWGNTPNWHDALVAAPEKHGGNWLFRHMASAGTWPAPIIVLDNAWGLVDPMFASPLPRLVLVEGHRRLEYIRAFFTMGKAMPQHSVWLAQVPGVSGHLP